ncbi:methyltransferase [Streptomyces sp. NPDC050610]|uniref:methyltransferase n=1 Tax=Streptomyces sp. NPDC050610 TaxID=3157097 RepID=UPI003432215E
MSDDPGMERSRELLRRHQEHTTREPHTFTALRKKWDVFPGVFSPEFTPVTAMFTTWLPYPPDGAFLEVGSGTGVTAVWAALQGCRRVVALDINPAAVENTRANACRHDVSDRVTVLHSDLFDALPPDVVFDVIFWNSNYVEPPADFSLDTMLHHAFFDPGYAAHRRFLAEAPAHLAPDGRLLLGFSDVGNHELLRQLCDTYGLTLSTLRSEVRELHMTVEFQLLELTPARHRP